ncbi:MAG: hypothetical protein ACLPVY_15390 [Acidimicrobiia bacterium]
MRTLLIVEDPESMVDQAVAADATQIQPVENEDSWPLERIEDPFGAVRRAWEAFDRVAARAALIRG